MSFDEPVHTVDALDSRREFFAEGAEPLPRGRVAERAPVLFLSVNASASCKPGQTYRIQVLEGVDAQDIRERRESIIRNTLETPERQSHAAPEPNGPDGVQQRSRFEQHEAARARLDVVD